MKKSLGETYQQELFETAVRLDSRLSDKIPPPQGLFFHAAEIFFNFAGILIGWLFIALPGPGFGNRTTSYFTSIKSGRPPPPLGADSEERLRSLQALLAGRRAGAAPPPAILTLTSHPDTANAEARLLGDLIWHAIRIANALAPESKFKFVQAVDDFALDTLPLPMKGAYAGAILAGHIPIERMPAAKTRVEKWIFRRAHYAKAFFEIARNLKGGKIVCAALSGGVSHNSKVLYCVREFAQRAFKLSRPKGVSKRSYELKMLSLLTEEDPCACVSGRLSEKEGQSLRTFLEESGLPGPKATELMKDLEEEIRLKVPYRRRFFKALFGRVCRKGTPLLLIPMDHSDGGEIRFNPPALIEKYDGGRKMVTVWEEIGREGPESQPKESGLEEFVKTFVTRSFS